MKTLWVFSDSVTHFTKIKQFIYFHGLEKTIALKKIFSDLVNMKDTELLKCFMV